MSLDEMDKFWKEKYVVFFSVANAPIIIGLIVIVALQYFDPSYSPDFFLDALAELESTNDGTLLLPIAAWGLACLIIGPSIGMAVGFVILYNTSKISWKELFMLQLILKTPVSWLSE